jgi:hypothetical protein
MAQRMDLGVLGNPNIVLKRKFRWAFTVENVCGGSVPEHFVKIAARPNITIEETEINFMNAKTWIPGKAAWETISVTYYDVATADNQNLWKWLASVYDFNRGGTHSYQASVRGGAGQGVGYAGLGRLKLYDGCGTAIEEWEMRDVWPTAINFGDLDYSSSDTADIELTLRYSQVSYSSLGIDTAGCCSGTGSALSFV